MGAGKPTHQPVADREVDYRVAEELEPLVMHLKMTAVQIACWLIGIAQTVNLDMIRKAKRRPKESTPKRVFDPAHPRVSTAKIHLGRAEDFRLSDHPERSARSFAAGAFEGLSEVSGDAGCVNSLTQVRHPPVGLLKARKGGSSP